MAEKRKPGRPQYQPTPALRRDVSICAGGGMAHDEIALALGIDRNTLEKHFQRELSIGAYERRAEVVKAMYRTARKGNVTAQKAYIALAPGLAAPPLQPEAKADPKPVALGKKEQQQVDAVGAQAGTDWAELLPRPGSMQ